MIGDENEAMRFAQAVRAAGVLVVAFSHPVVPRGEARIRVQLSAAHNDEEIDRATAAFVAAREEVRAA
jgi:glycine C-acetyltransferase